MLNGIWSSRTVPSYGDLHVGIIYSLMRRVVPELARGSAFRLTYTDLIRFRTFTILRIVTYIFHTYAHTYIEEYFLFYSDRNHKFFFFCFVLDSIASLEYGSNCHYNTNIVFPLRLVPLQARTFNPKPRPPKATQDQPKPAQA